jgi:hypothetical protein
MIYGKKRRRPIRPPVIKCWLPILAMCLLGSMPTHAQGSTEPARPESRPVSVPPARLYTEEEALAAARTAAEAAVDAAIPLAVQAAVAEERGKAAAQQVLDRAAAEAYRRQARNWRTAALVASGVGMGALAGGGRGAVFGGVGGAVAAGIWWVVENWVWRRVVSLSP